MGTPEHDNQHRSQQTLKKTLELGVAGGLAFWATNFATSLLPIAAEYRAELSISYALMVLVESLVGGLILGCCVGYALLRLSDRIPTESPILKSVTLSLVALVVIQAFATLLDLGYPPYYIVLGAGLNVPRFIALGLVIGALYDRLSDRAPGESKARGRPSSA
jgi:NhaP-type Na+/H+ and K+/H+ antiporter